MNWRLRSIIPFLILLAVFSVQWLLLFSLRAPTWDAVSYYVYARSAVFDHDLEFANDYQLSYPTAGEDFASKELDQIQTVTGYVQNIFAVGTSVLWLPWLALLRLAAVFNWAPGVASTAMTGYEPFFVANISMLSVLFGFLAYLISYLVTESVTSRMIALAATITLMFATPLLYYQFREPMYSHTASAMVVALVVLFWWRQLQAEQFGFWQGLVLGALIGLAGLVRWQNLAYLALPAVSITMWWFSLPRDERNHTWLEVAVYLLLVAAGALLAFALQMIVWRVLYGSFITIPQGSGFMDWRAPYLNPLLFSTFRGLLPWMPVFFLSLVGLLALSRRSPQLAWPLLIMLLLVIYINGSTRDWFAGGGYGPRRLTSELVLLVVGYAGFLQLVPCHLRSWIATFLGVLLGSHQWLLLRYGLAESLGGRVLSMNPTFEWEDEALSTFLTDLLRLANESAQDPLQALVFPGSPLDVFLRLREPSWEHLTVLIMTSLFVILLFVVALLVQQSAASRSH